MVTLLKPICNQTLKPLLHQNRFDYVYATATRNVNRSITWIDLFVDSNCNIKNVEFRECCFSDIDEADYERIISLSEEYARSRVNTTKRYSPNQKIGRNEFCPCGSEMKYKRCCINLD